jgi:hypothetical protein
LYQHKVFDVSAASSEIPFLAEVIYTAARNGRLPAR